MTMTKTLTISLAAGALLLAGTAVAQTTPAAPAAEMTRDAAQQRAAQMFTRLDANADGQIDAADRQARTENRAENRFDRLDANSDGAISRTEFAAIGAMRGDGRRGRGGNRGGRGEGRGGAMIGNADADSNGTVTQAEFNSAVLARFDAADANDDGVVSREERRAARPEGMRRGGGDGRRGHRGMGR